MGTLHKLLIDYGREQAMRMTDPEDRHLVRVAADILAEEDDAIGVTYSGFCQASLPHKRLPNDKEWIQQSERLTLMIGICSPFCSDERWAGWLNIADEALRERVATLC